jgi:hypothetical protein
MLPSYSRLSQSALIIGQTSHLLKPVANLLDRTGFDVSVIYRGNSLRLFSAVKELRVSNSEASFLEDIKGILNQHFDLIVLTDDLTISNIVHSHLPEQIKAKILPVISKSYWAHLGSKNALSSYLQNSRVLQPQFVIAQSQQDLERAALALGFPLLLKIDFSGGGTGVFECANVEQVYAAPLPTDCFPLLLQKKIVGAVIDLSGFFYQGHMIHYSYSEFMHHANAFSPSVIRRFVIRQATDPLIVDELNMLGRALGLNGFVNISCIFSNEDGKRYYFEADVRPNAWVNFPFYLNDDPAKVLNTLFQAGAVLSIPNYPTNLLHDSIQIPYVFRLSVWEILINKYGVWRFCKEYSLVEIWQYCISLAQSHAIRGKENATQKYQAYKHRFYHRPLYLVEMGLITYVLPRLPKQLAVKLTLCYKKLRSVGRAKN